MHKLSLCTWCAWTTGSWVGWGLEVCIYSIYVIFSVNDKLEVPVNVNCVCPGEVLTYTCNKYHWSGYHNMGRECFRLPQ